MIRLVRCDDRMIHGQCIVRVLGDFGIQQIVGVDDFTASNVVLKNIYQLAVPPGVQSDVLTTADAVAALPEHSASGATTLVLVKNPETALALFRGCPALPKELNIGPMSSRKDTTKVTLYAYLTAGEIAALDEMTAMGVRVYFNQLLEQRTEEWPALRASLGIT